uniref:Threonine/serine exporter-like N-terminal domain-containing protein n=1 Tax=Setaria digitata TaxID=48799 RepID=A0A915Q3P3_9BILA
MEVAYRYREQIETTVETMRRRCLAVYDGTISLGQKTVRVAEKLREYAEPIAYEVSESVQSAVQDLSPLDSSDRDFRNNLLELYLSCSVLSIGIGAGEISGALILGMLYRRIFDWWWEMLFVILLPCHVYLTFRKNAGNFLKFIPNFHLAALDETERRVNLFGLALAIGSCIGHMMGYRLISTLPSVSFIQPLILALTVDPELSTSVVYSQRQNLLAVGTAVGIAVATFLGMIHGLSFCIILSIAAQAAFLAIHLQSRLYLALALLVPPNNLYFSEIR